MRRKPKPPLEGLAVAFPASGIPGTFSVIATVPNFGAPIGIVWYQMAFTRQSIQIVSSWVDPRWRRRGVRTRLNDALFEGYATGEFILDRIVSTFGTKDGGAAFMKATGYRIVPDVWGGSWELTRRAWEANRKRRAAR